MSEKEALYPDEASAVLLEYVAGPEELPSLSVARRCGAGGAGREGVRDAAETLNAILYR